MNVLLPADVPLPRSAVPRSAVPPVMYKAAKSPAADSVTVASRNVRPPPVTTRVWAAAVASNVPPAIDTVPAVIVNVAATVAPVWNVKSIEVPTDTSAE